MSNIIQDNLELLRRETNSSLSAIIGLNSRNFTAFYTAMTTFLNEISFNETSNSMTLDNIVVNTLLRANGTISIGPSGQSAKTTMDQNGNIVSVAITTDSINSKVLRFTSEVDITQAGLPGQIGYSATPQNTEGVYFYHSTAGWLKLATGSTSGGGGQTVGDINFVDTTSVLWTISGEDVQASVSNSYVRGLISASSGITYNSGTGAITLGGTLGSNTTIGGGTHTLTFNNLTGFSLVVNGTATLSTTQTTLASDTVAIATDVFDVVSTTSGIQGTTLTLGATGNTFLKIDSYGSKTVNQALVLKNTTTGLAGWKALDTGDVSEGSNLYFTNARARAVISAGTGISYNSTSGVVSINTSYLDTLYISDTERGVANGVASLDSSGKVPVAQMPTLSYGTLQQVLTAGSTLTSAHVIACGTNNLDFTNVGTFGISGAAIGLNASTGNISIAAPSGALSFSCDNNISFGSSSGQVIITADTDILIQTNGGTIALTGGDIEVDGIQSYSSGSYEFIVRTTTDSKIVVFDPTQLSLQYVMNNGATTTGGATFGNTVVVPGLNITSGTDNASLRINGTGSHLVYFPVNGTDPQTVAYQNSVSGTFTTVDGKTITITNGLVTAITS
jgi:hypothetical protein